MGTALEGIRVLDHHVGGLHQRLEHLPALG